LLTDEARHRVGIEYKEAGQQSAIELGAKLLPEEARAELVQQWLKFAEENPTGYLYCFRGGLRSRITQQWLKEAGCDYRIVTGGYKALRQFLIQALQKRVDLEALAKHRGSSFGRMVVEQPSNIDFENAISIALLGFADNTPEPIYLEDEARMIGSACIPEPMRKQTQLAPVAILETPIETRVQYGVEDYVVDLLSRYKTHHGEVDGFRAFADYHRASLSRVQKRLGGVRYQQARALLDAALREHESKNELAGYHEFIELILTDYYDPMYDYQMKGKKERVVFTGDASALLEWAANFRQSAVAETL